MRVEVEIDTRGAFLDFKLMDHHLGQVVSQFDHAMLLEKSDPLLEVLSSMGFRCYPFDEEPTTEAIAHLVMDKMRRFHIHVMRVTVYETSKYSATVVWSAQ